MVIPTVGLEVRMKEVGVRYQGEKIEVLKRKLIWGR